MMYFNFVVGLYAVRLNYVDVPVCRVHFFVNICMKKGKIKEN